MRKLIVGSLMFAVASAFVCAPTPVPKANRRRAASCKSSSSSSSSSSDASPERPHTTKEDRVLRFDPRRGRDETGPRLECDNLEPALNAFVEDAHAHSLRWAVAVGLVPESGRAFQRLEGLRAAWLAARVYPLVGRDELCLVADLFSVLFAFDDLVEDQHADALRVTTEQNRFVAVGRGAPVRKGDSTLTKALADVVGRVAELGDDEKAWLGRFGESIADYVAGCRWELHFREGAVPSRAAYAKMRPLTSAVAPAIALVGLFLDNTRTDFADDALVRQLELAANNHVAWANDIYSIDKELNGGTTCNLVVVLAHDDDDGESSSRSSVWDKALDRAIEACNAELHAFADLEHVVVLRDDCDLARRAYVQGLKALIRGTLDWHSDTRRYSSSEQQLLPPGTVLSPP
eukprot:CAMPEP_0198645562 /NCGR_PEP_ID=MMETSP1467-20131203/1311_1 /TAXON_ID=1462469 /ORGANISM="unid. sp., Strain CCMP2135" /LENGTH=403 /DNA_ID=CAMNT_0044381055 /DNA_START=115 /DNA_END=1326 /DNA_ORIENTATION=-